MGVHFIDELVKRDEAGFLETVHASSDFNIDVAIVGNVNVILRVIAHFLRDKGWLDLDVLIVAHWGAKVVIFKSRLRWPEPLLAFWYQVFSRHWLSSCGLDGFLAFVDVCCR
jgi:hypothetical protein